jgi:hypothetical protein
MSTFSHRLPAGVALVIGAFLTTTACGSTGSPASSATTATPEVVVGEAVPVPYADARFHYRIDAPGRMTANPDGNAAYIGPSERLEIGVLQGPQASDPSTIAGQDIRSLSTSATGFHQLSSPAKLTLGGYQVIRFSYTWNAGTSAVTGKAIELTSVRYYLAKDSATLAVITYGIVSNQFDPQGADDIVSTFRWQ